MDERDISKSIDAIANVTNLRESKKPFFPGYRGCCKIKDDYLTSAVISSLEGETIPYGATHKATVAFIAPEEYPESLWPGKVMEIYEGERIVGSMKMISIENKLLEKMFEKDLQETKNFNLKTNHFSYKPEEGQNPYIGFLSYQHFRGETLYSDVIVRPEGNMLETENFECYPIPDYVEQKGRDEGFYPDTSVAYIRFLWKEFEPQRGEYNYKFIEDIIAKAKSHNQSLIFRLMPHSTRACDDVPDWLRELIPCPDRPDGKRVKDSPTDPLFLEYFGEAVRALGEKFDSDPALYAMDICMPGAWGEGHNLHLYSEESLKKLIDVYTSVFKKTLLMGQITNPAMIHYANRTVHVGWRGDGFGEPQHINERYPRQVEKIADVWKSAPVSFESYWWLGEWHRKGWDLDNIIDLTLRWHVSSFNAKSLPIPIEWKDKIDYWVQKMGYHFAVDSFSHPESAQKGDTIELVLNIDNVGVAPIYKKIPLHIRLIGGAEITFDTDVDITKWMPGKAVEKFCIALPDDIPVGKYDIEIGIYNAENPIVYLCTDAERNGSCYKVGKITIK